MCGTECRNVLMFIGIPEALIGPWDLWNYSYS